MSELPARLEYLDRVNGFLKVIIEEAKEDHLTQKEFLSLLVCKARCMLQENRENRSKGINLNNMMNRS